MVLGGWKLNRRNERIGQVKERQRPRTNLYHRTGQTHTASICGPKKSASEGRRVSTLQPHETSPISAEKPGRTTAGRQNTLKSERTSTLLCRGRRVRFWRCGRGGRSGCGREFTRIFTRLFVESAGIHWLE